MSVTPNQNSPDKSKLRKQILNQVMIVAVCVIFIMYVIRIRFKVTTKYKIL